MVNFYCTSCQVRREQLLQQENIKIASQIVVASLHSFTTACCPASKNWVRELLAAETRQLTNMSRYSYPGRKKRPLFRLLPDCGCNACWVDMLSTGIVLCTILNVVIVCYVSYFWYLNLERLDLMELENEIQRRQIELLQIKEVNTRYTSSLWLSIIYRHISMCLNLWHYLKSDNRKTITDHLQF